MQAPQNNPNVLLIVLDTVRASSTSLGGKETTPNLRKLGNSGARFEKAIAPAPWTLPSHASMYTGLYPSEHGTVTHRDVLSPDYETLAEQLWDAGYSTGLFTANAFLTGMFGMDQGFDTVRYIESTANKLFDDAFDFTQFTWANEFDSPGDMIPKLAGELSKGSTIKNTANLGKFLTNTLKRKIMRNGQSHQSAEWDATAIDNCIDFVSANRGDDPFFAMVNLTQAHGPWAFNEEKLRAIGVTPSELGSTEEWETVADRSGDNWGFAKGEITFDEAEREMLGCLYEAWIHSADQELGRLFQALEANSIAEDTLVIVTADHGECITEDDLLGHELSVSEHTTHVPLMIDGPAVPDVTIEAPVSVKDVYGTVLSETGVNQEVDSLFADESRGQAFAETYGVNCSRISERYKETCKQYGARQVLYIEESRVEYREKEDEIHGDASLRDELAEFVDSLNLDVDSSGERDELSEMVESRLEDFGYLQ